LQDLKKIACHIFDLLVFAAQKAGRRKYDKLFFFNLNQKRPPLQAALNYIEALKT